MRRMEGWVEGRMTQGKKEGKEGIRGRTVKSGWGRRGVTRRSSSSFMHNHASYFLPSLLFSLLKNTPPSTPCPPFPLPPPLSLQFFHFSILSFFLFFFLFLFLHLFASFSSPFPQHNLLFLFLPILPSFFLSIPSSFSFLFLPFPPA